MENYYNFSKFIMILRDEKVWSLPLFLYSIYNFPWKLTVCYVIYAQQKNQIPVALFGKIVP